MMATPLPSDSPKSLYDLLASADTLEKNTGSSHLSLLDLISSVPDSVRSRTDVLSLLQQVTSHPGSMVYIGLAQAALDLRIGLANVLEKLLLDEDEMTLAQLSFSQPDYGRTRRVQAYSSALRDLASQLHSQQLPIAIYRRLEDERRREDLLQLFCLNQANCDQDHLRGQLAKSLCVIQGCQSELRHRLQSLELPEDAWEELVGGWATLPLCSYLDTKSDLRLRTDLDHVRKAEEVVSFLWLSRVRGSFPPLSFERRVFPVPVYLLLARLPEADKLHAYQSALVQMAFPDILLYAELSATLSPTDKAGIHSLYERMHEQSLADWIHESLASQQGVFLAAFTRSFAEDCPYAKQWKAIRTVAESDSQLSAFLGRFAADPSILVCFIDIFSGPNSALDLAKSAVERLLFPRAGVAGRVVCLIVHCDKESIPWLHWEDRWQLRVFDELDSGYSETDVWARGQLWDASKVTSYFHMYFYSPGKQQPASEEDRQRTVRIINSPEIVEAVCRKLTDRGPVHDDADVYQRALSLPPKESLGRTMLAASENLGYAAVEEQLQTIDALQAFPSFFTREFPPAQSVWLAIFHKMDPLPMRQIALAAPLKLPFTMLEYMRVHTHKDDLQGQSLYSGILDHYPAALDMYIEDLAAVSLGLCECSSALGATIAKALFLSSSSMHVERLRYFMTYEGELQRICGKADGSPYRADLQVYLQHELGKMPPPALQRFLFDVAKEMNTPRNPHLYRAENSVLITYNCLTSLSRTTPLSQKVDPAEARIALLLSDSSVLFTGGRPKAMLLTFPPSPSSFLVLPSTGEVKHTQDLRSARCAHGAVEVRSHAYVMGGHGEAGATGQIERLAQETWEDYGSLTYARTHFNPCEAAGVVYVAGGSHRSIETFTPATGRCEVLRIDVPETTTGLAIAESSIAFRVLYKASHCLYHGTAQMLQAGESGTHSLSTVWSSASPVVFPSIGVVFILEEKRVKWVNWKTGIAKDAIPLI